MDKESFHIMHAHYSRYNFGDDATVTTLYQYIHHHTGRKTRFFDISQTFFKREGEPVEDFISLNAYYHLKNLRKLIALFARTDLVLIGGGELLCGLTEYLGLAVLGKALGIPVVFFSIGVNMKGASRLPRIYTKLALRLVDRIIVRDAEAAHELVRLKVPSFKVVRAADIVHLIQAPQPQSIHPGERKAGGDHALEIGIMLRGPESIRQIFGRQELSLLARSLDELITRHNCRIYFLNMLSSEAAGQIGSANVGEFADDQEVVNYVMSCMKHRDHVVTVEDGMAPEAVASFIRRLGLVISMRLHPLIIAFEENVPFIALSYAPKINRFMALVDCKELCLDFSRFNPDHFVEVVGGMLHHSDELKQKLRPLRDHQRGLAVKNLHEIEEVARQNEGRTRKAARFLFGLPLALLIFLLHNLVEKYKCIRLPVGLRRSGLNRSVMDRAVMEQDAKVAK